MTRHRIRLGMMLLIALCCAGCAEEGPPTYSVKGTITYQGAPVTTGQITFLPVGPGAAAIGVIAKDGAYQLETVAGPHRVGIVSLPEVPPGASFSDAVPPPNIPSYFERPETSGLEAEVKAETAGNDIDFALD